MGMGVRMRMKARMKARAGRPSPSRRWGPVPAQPSASTLTGGHRLFSTVGNIPYEATEEQLKDIFSEVGPVVSFR